MHDERDDTTSSTDEQKYRIDRREYLKATGAAAASVAAGPAFAGTAAANDYETITVSSGSVERFSLSDGETLENVLIDITADGAEYRINANGDGWAIRNVGIRGYYAGSDGEPIVVQCPNGGSGVIENVYIGDGGGNGSTGIFVFPDHSGHIDIDNVNVQGWSDNGVYASAPGNHDNHSNPGGDGTIAITNSYGAENGVANFRLGTNGSYCEGCVSVNSQGGYWGFYNETKLIDCDIDSNIRLGDATWQDCAVVNLENTRFSGGVSDHSGCGQVNGSSAGTPSTQIPAGVPTDAEEAASGSGSGGGDDGDGSTTEVAEDFSHNDVSGTYDLDTGAFTTTSTRSTTGSYAIRPDDSTDDGKLVLRNDMSTTAGTTYELDVYHQSSSGADMGFVFGAQSATSWSDYTGYFAIFESDTDEIRVDYWENGSQVNTAATDLTWPLDEWLTVELDYRDSDASTITMSVFDAAGEELGSVSLADTTHDSGTVGWYNYHAAGDWFADSWFEASRRNATEVAEDFSHGDVPGTYDLDTGAFATTSTRSTSDSYSLQPADSADGGKLILRDDMVTTAGTTYELDVYHQSASGADMGFVFGAQSATSWDDYTGYFAIFESDTDEIRVDYWENGSQVNAAATSMTWPLDEWLTVELDYRASDASTITMSVFDAAGQQLGSVSLADTTHDSGTVGWYNYHAASDWFADSWFEASGDGGDSGTVVDDFEDGDLSEYSFDRGSAGASVVSAPTRSGSYALEYAGTNTESISTSGLNAYPSAGDTFSYWVRASGGGGRTNMTYGVQDHQNRYFVRVDIAADDLALYRCENDTSSDFASDWDAPTLSQDAWYEVEVQWGTDGTHTVTLYDASGTQLSQISGTDATWSSGGVGFDAYLGSGESVYFDDVTIE